MENNNHDIKLCPACGTKNKSAYKYCNECGAPLNQTDYSGANNTNVPPVYNNVQGEQNYGYNASANFNGPQYNGQFGESGYTPYPPFDSTMNAPYFGTPDFSGVSAKDLYEFTGRNTNLFYKLRMQHFSGKNTPFCWPLFVLGLIFNFFGMGCWYLYHKMYKPAIGFFAAAFADLILKGLTFLLVFDGITTEQIKAILENSDNAAGILYDYINSPNMMLISMLDTITNALSLTAFALAIILPFFAYKQYKNFAICKIYEQYSKSPLPNISAAGGTKGGLVAITSVIYVIVFLVVIISSFIPFTSKFIKVAKDEILSNTPNTYNEMPFDFGEEFPFDNGSGEMW